MTLLVASGLVKRFPGADDAVLDGVDLEVRAGDRLAIVGVSGSGKSTLLHLLGLLDTPTEGTVTIAGQPTGGLSEAERARLRREHLGFVFQDHHLLPQLSALDNVLVPCLAVGAPTPADVARATDLLGRLGLGERLHHLPAQLSTGQRQRVAVARALILRPSVVLADEPTGSLDRTRARELVQLLLDAPEEVALVVVTHDPEVAAAMDRVLALEEGRLVPRDRR